jgi:hypothetical protein
VENSQPKLAIVVTGAVIMIAGYFHVEHRDFEKAMFDKGCQPVREAESVPSPLDGSPLPNETQQLIWRCADGTTMLN